MTLVIEDRDLGGGYIEAYFTALPQPGYMAIQEDVRPETRRARCMEAHAYYRRPPRSGRKVSYVQSNPDKVDEQTISALRRVVEYHLTSEEQQEVRCSYVACEYCDAYWIAWDCELHPYVVIALLRNWAERGELPET